MLDSEVRPKMVGSKRISTALAIELGLPVDIIEQAIEKALKKELEQNEEQSGDNTLDNSFPSSPTNIQDSEPVNELSRSNHDLHPSPDNGSEIHKIQIESSTQSFKKNRKDSLSSLIEITQSGSTSINIKLPSLYASSQTVQGEISQSLAGSTKKPSDININSVDGNLNRTENILYSDEQNIHNKGLMQDQQNDSFSNISKEYIQPQNTIMPEVQNRQNNSVSNISEEYIQPQNTIMPERQNDSVPDVSKEYIQPQNTIMPEVQNWQNNSVSNEYIQPQNTIMPEVQNRQNDSVPDVSKEYIQPQIQNTYEPFMPEAQSRQIDSAPDEFIQPQRRDSLDQVQDTYDTYESFMPETEVSNVSNQRQQVYKSFSNGSHSYTSQSQVYISQVIDQQPQPKLDLIKNKPSEMYLSEFPSLSEAAKKGDSRKNSEVDLGAWGQMDVNIASAWGKPKKWLPETTETVIPEPPVTTWNPDDVNQLTWKPIQEPKAPIFFKKKKTAPVNFELDDNEGWGAPPTKFIPWDDSRQGYCVDLIEEQQGTVFWSVQNGTWVNVSEEVKITQEMKITQEKRIVECTSDGVNHRNIRQTRTHTQRTRQGIDNLDGATWDDIREQTRRERVEKGLAKNEILMIDLTDDDNSNSNSSKIEDFQSNSAKCTTTSEGPRERLGNPRWKTEEEWRVPKSFQSLINLDMQDASDSKNSDEETSNDRDENVNFNEEISNWDEDSENISEERSTRAIMDIETVKDDAWFIDDVMVDEQKRREDMIKESEENLLLINVDSNSDNVATESTIINTHPPIFHGTINNEMADSNDFILDYTNSNTTNMDIMNNSEYNLLSFDDEEDNKVPNSSDDVIKQPQENMHSFDFDKFEDFLENNRVTGVPASDDNKFEIVQPKIEVTEDPNKLQSVSPYIINLNDNESSPTIDTFNQPKSYYREDFSQATTPQTYSQIESITPSSTLDVNVRDSENKGSVNDPNSTRATANVREYFININVETPSDGRQILRLSYDDNPQDVTTEFCRKWNMFQFEDALTGLVQKELKRKLRKRKGKCKINS